MLATLREFIRPISVAALVAVLLIGAVVSGALEAFWPGMGVAFTNGVAGWFRAVPGPFYDLVTAGFLTYGAARTVEKATSSYASAKYNSSLRPMPGPRFGNVKPDNPDNMEDK